MRGWPRARPLGASRLSRASWCGNIMPRLLHAYGFRPGFVLGMGLHR
jgi:hypothetical protein